MTKTFFLVLLFSGLVASLGFTSCNDKNKTSASTSDSLTSDSISALIPDTSIINSSALTDSGWNNAAESIRKESTLTIDSTSKSNEKSLVKPKPTASSKVNPNKPKELLDGIEKAKNGDLRGAIADFDLCLKMNDKNYNAYFYKAKALIELNEPQKAKDNLDQAIKFNSVNPVLFYYRGKLLFDEGKTDLAFADFDKAVSLNPEFPDALNYRGVTKEVQGKHTEAIEDYKAAIKISPEFSTAYYNKGTSEAALELYKDAILSFSTCIEIDPKNTVGYMNRGNCYVMLKEYTSAVNDYTTAISLNPKSANAYYNRGAAYQLAGNKNACNDWLKAQSLGDKRAGEMLKKYCN